MHKTLRKLVLMMIGVLLCLPALAGVTAEEKPIIELKTNAYATLGETNSFSILLGGIKKGDYIDVDCGFGSVEYELLPATYNDSTGSLSGTLITCNVSKEGVVKIYGNAENIDVMNASGCYITDISFPGLTNLSILDLSHNELKKLDLSAFSKLQALYLNDNPFDEKPLIVGGNKPGLAILDIGQSSGLDASFNLSDYPSLVTFDAWSNKGLTKLDPTGCPELQKISIDSSPVKKIDVTKNPKLVVLNVSDTGISSLNLSKNPYLRELYCVHMSGTVNAGVKIPVLDVTNNPALVYLFASGNNIRSIDLSKNLELQDLYLTNNKLTALDLSKNSKLLNVSVKYNDMSFATLPLPGEWNQYECQQNPMKVAKSFKVGSVIDLSDKVLRKGTTTTAALYQVKDSEPGVSTPLGSDYYTYADGKITLLKAVSDSVYLAFANDAFPTSALASYPHCTTRFLVKTAADYGKDDLAAVIKMPVASSAGTPVVMSIGMDGATPQSPKKFYVDYGNGKVEYAATSALEPDKANVTGTNTTSGTVTIYVPENELLTALAINGTTLNSIDLSKSQALSELRLVNTGLYSIDLQWNRKLTKLELTGNHFSTLNIRGANDYYQKNLLHDINLSNNELTSVNLNDNYTIHNLNLSHNKLTELEFKDADMMQTLDLSDNQLTSLNVSYCTQMTKLDVSGNKLTSLVLPTETSLSSLNLSGNAFTFATLPALSGIDNYVFAPQENLQISKKGPGVDLSEQNVGGKTTYAWFKADGSELAKGTGYTEENGVFRFDKSILGSTLHCEMVNPAFAGLTLKTSDIVASEMPQHVFASFTTTKDQTATMVLRASERNTPIYIDWKGNGVDLEQYVLGTTNSNITATTHAGAEVKLYSYDKDCNLTVFSISDAALSSLDVTALKKLQTLTVRNAGLSEIKLPDSKDLFEVFLDGNNLSSIDLTKYANLTALTLNKNKFVTFDASPYKSLQLLGIGDNQLRSLRLNNPLLWQLSVSGNGMSKLDLSKVPNMENLSLANNNFSTIDVSKLTKLKMLLLDRNKFKFSTLPPVKDSYARYTYSNQARLDVAAQGNTVDISSEAVVDGTATAYRWFLDEPYTDEEGNLTGEELVAGEEFNVKKGVTTFTTSFNGVTCVLTNAKFPALTLQTPLLNVGTTGIETTLADGNKVSVRVSGSDIVVKTEAAAPVKLYGVGGQLLKNVDAPAGGCTLNAQTQGLYVVTVGNKSFKVSVK